MALIRCAVPSCSKYCGLTFLEKTNGVITMNAGILRQELIKRIATFEVVEQNFHGHAGALGRPTRFTP